MSASHPRGPLHRFRILEVCHVLAGPYCGMLLADLGAEVIKIETGEGDIARQTGVHKVGDHNVYFASLNRNKKSVRLDLTEPMGRQAFEELVKTAHGLITNLRPRAIKKLGLTYAALKELNPNLVCLALTGFGLEGPYSEYPAYDYIIQAMTGVALLTGEAGTPPVRVGYSVVDNTGGSVGAIGVLAKLAEGRGGQVDVALYDAVLSQLNYLASAYLNAGEEPKRLPGHSYFVPAQIFATADGYLALFITHDQFWRILAEKLDRPDWLTDCRFATMAQRFRNRDLVLSEVARELRQRTCAQWVNLLQPSGLPVAGVATMAEALRHPNTAARGMIAHVATAAGVIQLIANPIKFDDVEQLYAPPPRLGEHTHEYAPSLTPGRVEGT